MIKKLEFRLLAVLILLKIEFWQAQISVPKTDAAMSKIVYINLCPIF